MDIKKIFAGRMLLLLPAAFCIFLVLESQDKSIRLAAVICLLLIAQIREWLLLRAKQF
ncbi:MAG: hypothetical protein QXT25_00530 [Candidatus Anstonellaceae archaeon]